MRMNRTPLEKLKALSIVFLIQPSPLSRITLSLSLPLNFQKYSMYLPCLCTAVAILQSKRSSSFLRDFIEE
ncbi:hypothetical protein AAHA92_31053 [Salvia divinorum]|uniref:Uncharacterized protein n=1 Tax=Salvia divinorum TaxID=28513 RepID=A0ABD1FVR6_SALDI